MMIDIPDQLVKTVREAKKASEEFAATHSRLGTEMTDRTKTEAVRTAAREQRSAIESKYHNARRAMEKGVGEIQKLVAETITK